MIKTTNGIAIASHSVQTFRDGTDAIGVARLAAMYHTRSRNSMMQVMPKVTPTIPAQYQTKTRLKLVLLRRDRLSIRLMCLVPICSLLPRRYQYIRFVDHIVLTSYECV